MFPTADPFTYAILLIKNSFSSHIFLFLLSGDGGYARDARLKAPSSLTVAPNGTLYIADLGNIRIRAVSPNQPLAGPAGLLEISSPLDQELYLFSQVRRTLAQSVQHVYLNVSRYFIYCIFQ